MSADLESELAALGARWNETVPHVDPSEVFGDGEPFMFDPVVQLQPEHSGEQTARRRWLVAAAAGVLVVALVGALTLRSDDRSDERAQPLQAGPADTGPADTSVVADSIPTLQAAPVATGVPLELDRGFADGLLTGMPVVNAAGLVGRVASATADRSVVMMVTDNTFTVYANVVDATTGLTSTTGMIAGRGAGMPLQFRTLSDDLTQPARVPNIGDVVVTAGGEDSLAPAGIPIGTITAAAATISDTSTPTLEVEPFVDQVPEHSVRILLFQPQP